MKKDRSLIKAQPLSEEMLSKIAANAIKAAIADHLQVEEASDPPHISQKIQAEVKRVRAATTKCLERLAVAERLIQEVGWGEPNRVDIEYFEIDYPDRVHVKIFWYVGAFVFTCDISRGGFSCEQNARGCSHNPHRIDSCNDLEDAADLLHRWKKELK